MDTLKNDEDLDVHVLFNYNQMYYEVNGETVELDYLPITVEQQDRALDQILEQAVPEDDADDLEGAGATEDL